MNEQEVSAAVKIGQLETQMNNIEKKVDVGFLEMKQAIKELNGKMDTASKLESKVDGLEADIKTLKKNRSIMNVVIPIASAASGAVLAILIISYIAHGGK